MNDLGASQYSATTTFTVMTPPARTTLVLPANNAQNVISDSVVFAWRIVGNAASYNLQLSTVNSTTTYSGITDTTFMVRGLAKLTNYNWKVEGINAGGSSYYTAPSAFTTIVAPPPVPATLLPASGATGVDRRTRFVWNSALNATKYRLQIATDNLFATIIRDSVVFDTTATLTDTLAESSDFYWRIRGENIGGASNYSTAVLFSTGTLVGVEEIGEVPKEFSLSQNYPNPFNPSTTISYDVPRNAHVSLVIYDILGREVATLVNEVQTANRYQVVWNATNVSTGVYFYLMTAKSADGSGDFNFVRKLLLMK